jgi:hypothetical protein
MSVSKKKKISTLKLRTFQTTPNFATLTTPTVCVDRKLMPALTLLLTPTPLLTPTTLLTPTPVPAPTPFSTTTPKSEKSIRIAGNFVRQISIRRLRASSTWSQGFDRHKTCSSSPILRPGKAN